ncbi:hypothetical protein ACIQVE_20020, partial [Pseudomonas sp. NPDC098747]|uniref:hypothetical protein n=1 Tax=Pseudomonas sp. NPDC098747 TaxID=3364487 RepID=UPI00383B74F8
KQGYRSIKTMLFHAISLFMRRKGNRVKPRAYQAATTNGYRNESRNLPISSGIKTHWGADTMKLLSSVADNNRLALPQHLA